MVKTSTLWDQIANLFPGYFALVMATGIVSIACHMLEIAWLAWGLFAINAVAYVVLWGLTAARLARFPRRLWGDLTDHGRGPGFFTVVAGTCVLGTQTFTLTGDVALPTILWWLGIALHGVIFYTFFTAVMVGDQKSELEVGLNGAWLIAVVATQAVAVLGVLLAPGEGQATQLFFSLCMFLIGSLLYLPLITLILYRFIFIALPPEDLTPPYWINMGATAITTLAGATLILHADAWPFLGELLPFLKGFTLFFWATATGWIPMLLLLGIWRHVVRRHPLRYNPQYWGLVFPLGMYTACTVQLGRALELPLLQPIAEGFIFVALTAWAATFGGLVWHLVGLARGR